MGVERALSLEVWREGVILVEEALLVLLVEEVI